MKKVAVYHTSDTKHVGQALFDGLNKCGYIAEIEPRSLDGFSLLAFYGMNEEHAKMMLKMKAIGIKTLVVDAPFFGRTDGYMKITVDGLHPHTYFQRFKHDGDRFSKFNIEVKPMRKEGDHILLAGIGPKSSKYYKMIHQSWDEQAVKTLKKYTNKRILYRAKPNHVHTYHPIPGTIWTQPKVDLNALIDRASAIVTHHSNVAIDGLVRGVPCFAKDGIPSVIGLTDLTKINNPKLHSRIDQMQILYDIAYTQWHMDEISSGKCIDHMQKEGLI